MILTKSGPKQELRSRQLVFKRFIVKIFKKSVVLGVGDGNAGRQDLTYVTPGVKHKETDN